MKYIFFPIAFAFGLILVFYVGKLEATDTIKVGQVWIRCEGDSENPFETERFYTNTVLGVKNGYVLYSSNRGLFSINLSVRERYFRYKSYRAEEPKVEK